MKKWHLVVDLEKCIGCYNCYVACKDEYVDNDWPKYSLPQKRHDQKWIDPEHKERGQHPLIDVTYLPRLCMHCENAPCVKNSNGAIYKREDGIVLIDPIKAQGRSELVKSCPYGMISWNDEYKVPQKCTFCAHLLDEGWKKARCVQACPLGALRMEYMEENDFNNLIREEKLEVLHPEIQTKPQVYYKNLYRYTKCFIAGSVAYKKEGIERCAEGCRVCLLKDKEKIIEKVTDNYGDFKFDGLSENSGKYMLEFYFNGYSKLLKEVKLGKSINIGVINL
ncbi:MAG: oxidoreductase [Peptococcaceae bacterium]|nr:oxidoreductase [Peptococcaceae bacterium]